MINHKLLSALIFLISLSLTIIFAEFLLRKCVLPIGNKYHFEPYVVVNDEHRGYKLNPGKTTRMSNGFFNEDITVDRLGNRDLYDNAFENKGLVAIGDSQTFGYGIPAADSWPEQLQTLLGVNVINAGVFGYSPNQYVPTLQEHFEQEIKVEHVFYAATFNDVFGSSTPNQSRVNKRGYLVETSQHGYSSNTLKKTIGFIRYRTAIGKLFESAVRSILPQIVIHKKTSAVEECENFLNFIEELQQYLNKKGANLYVTYISSGTYILPQSRELIFKLRDYDYRFVGDHLEQLMVERNINFIDATDALNEHASQNSFVPSSLMLPVDGHYNGSANKVIATLLAKLYENNKSRTVLQ